MNWKIVYVGIDTLYQALPALVKAGCRVCEIVSCPVDNETEFNLRTCAFAKEHSIPLLIGKITREDVKRWKEAGIDALICCGYYYRKGSLAHAGHSPGGIKGKRDNHT